jgi:HEAT repeat protein
MKSTTWWTAVVCAAALGAGAVAARAQDMAGRTHANGPAAAAGRTVASAAAPAARPHRALLERWLPGDAADSLYRLARRELNAGDYEQAARHFREVRERFPKSGYVADSYYWEAFALSRTGSNDDSRRALDVLAERRQRFPKAAGAQDARDLETQIRGQLARGGDVEAAEVLARQAATVASQGAGVAAQAAAAEAEVGAVAQSIAAGSAGLEAIGTGLQALGSGSCDDSDDERLMALNALLQMNSDQAVPLLKKVLERRDEGSVCLRRKALFVLAQKRTPEIEDVLLQAAGSDPDAQVRESAVFWLSQVHTTRATAALDSILQHSEDEAIRKRAVFALAQQHSDASAKALRDYLQGAGGSEKLKENIVFWLGQQHSEANRTFLRQYFGRATSESMKKKIVFSLAQSGDSADATWLLGIARDPKQGMDLRKNALFWAGQTHAVDVARIAGLYDGLQSPELKDRLIFVLSQRQEAVAVDKLMDIAKNDPDHELRKKAIFWLGQSHDPRAAKFLMDIIGQ